MPFFFSVPKSLKLKSIGIDQPQGSETLENAKNSNGIPFMYQIILLKCFIVQVLRTATLLDRSVGMRRVDIHDRSYQ